MGKFDLTGKEWGIFKTGIREGGEDRYGNVMEQEETNTVLATFKDRKGLEEAQEQCADHNSEIYFCTVIKSSDELF